MHLWQHVAHVAQSSCMCALLICCAFVLMLCACVLMCCACLPVCDAAGLDMRCLSGATEFNDANFGYWGHMSSYTDYCANNQW
jgi:hypothetical protein